MLERVLIPSPTDSTEALLDGLDQAVTKLLSPEIEAIGFGFRLDDKGEQYLHEAGIHFCTPDGHVAKEIQFVVSPP